MKGNVESVYCEFKYSGVGGLFIVVASSCTAALLAATPMSVALRSAIGLYLASIAIHAWRSLRRVRRLWVDVRGNIEIELRNGRRLRGTVGGGSIVAHWLTIVRLRTEGGRWGGAVVVFPDMLAREDFRQLRVILRWCRVDQYCGSGGKLKKIPTLGSRK